MSTPAWSSRTLSPGRSALEIGQDHGAEPSVPVHKRAHRCERPRVHLSLSHGAVLSVNVRLGDQPGEETGFGKNVINP